MLRFWRFVRCDGGGGVGQNGLRQNRVHDQSRRRVSRLLRHVLSHASARLLKSFGQKPEDTSHRTNIERSHPMKIVDQEANAAEFIKDVTHEQHLDQLLWMLRVKRDEAASRVPEWEQLRDLASQIKEHTLSNLAHYLEMFESRAQANGVTVHWARDAHEHNQIVYQLLSDRNVNELIKSKSMLTEECDTRKFLEERGVRVSETDLGERIQQLDDQPPSHIVGPAWHKTE